MFLRFFEIYSMRLILGKKCLQKHASTSLGFLGSSESSLLFTHHKSTSLNLERLQFAHAAQLSNVLNPWEYAIAHANFPTDGVCFRNLESKGKH